MTVFLRVLEYAVDDKADALRLAVARFSDGEQDGQARRQIVFERAPDQFTAVPGSPLAYWAPGKCLQLFTRNDQLNKAPRLVVSTNPLNADFRFVRV